MTRVAKNRIIDISFKNDLQNGILNPVLERIQKDLTLDFHSRANIVDIYYRGGRLLQIAQKSHSYKCDFDTKYIIAPDDQLRLPDFPLEVSSLDQCRQLVNLFPVIKQIIDIYLASNNKLEREFQQLFVRENNYSAVSNATDYFAVDIEYAAGKARFDILGIKWESDGKLRQKNGLKNHPPKLVLFEMKYYTTALDGNAGIEKHLNDIDSFLSNEVDLENLKQEALEIFALKRELKLVRFGAGGNNNQVTMLDQRPEVVLLLVNYDPECTKLETILPRLQPIENADLKIAVSTFLGYGLFKENVYSLEEFRDKFSSQL